MKKKTLWIIFTAVLVGLIGIGGLLTVQRSQEPYQPVTTEAEELQKQQFGSDTDFAPSGTIHIDAMISQDIEPQDSVPELTDPDRSLTEPTEPKGTEPEQTEPIPTIPEDIPPKKTEPNPTEPASAKPVQVELEVEQPKATEPAYKEPPPTEPDITEPDRSGPGVIEPPETQPEATEPELPQPEVTIPEEIPPTISEPEVTEPEPTEPENTEPLPTEPPKPERQEPRAATFTVYDADGNPVNLSDYFGKPIVLNFWASWCGPCKREMPGFQQLYEELGNQVQFLMVNLTGYDDPVSVQALISQNGYTFPVLFDTILDGADTYGVTAFPTTFFIDGEGYLMEKYVGAMDEGTLRSKIDLIR